MGLFLFSDIQIIWKIFERNKLKYYVYLNIVYMKINNFKFRGIKLFNSLKKNLWNIAHLILLQKKFNIELYKCKIIIPIILKL